MHAARLIGYASDVLGWLTRRNAIAFHFDQGTLHWIEIEGDEFVYYCDCGEGYVGENKIIGRFKSGSEAMRAMDSQIMIDNNVRAELEVHFGWFDQTALEDLDAHEQKAAIEDLNEGRAIIDEAGEHWDRIEKATPASMFWTKKGIKFVPENGVPQFNKAFVVPFDAIKIKPMPSSFQEA
jgi:hypothetical protein